MFDHLRAAITWRRDSWRHTAERDWISRVPQAPVL